VINDSIASHPISREGSVPATHEEDQGARNTGPSSGTAREREMIGKGEDPETRTPFDGAEDEIPAVDTFDDEIDIIYDQEESLYPCGEPGEQDDESWGCWDGECYACGLEWPNK
jgi:hypothetical protein